jgi:hypothetical protein
MSGFEFNEEMAWKWVFQRADDPELIGVLDFSGPEMTFTGRADESAKVFFDAVIKNQVGWTKHLEDLRRELAAMREQRDEARRDLCFEKSNRPEWYAAECGWDCFKEGGGA